MNDPFVGTWKLNIGKSKFAGPRKPPKEVTIIIEEEGDHAFDTVKGVAADGSPIFDKYTFPSSGGSVAVLEGGGGFPAGTSGVLAPRKADSHTKNWTITLPFGAVITEQDVLSEDGKTMVMTTRGTDAEGNSYENIEVFDREAR